jgi:hypothetical protein
MFRRLSEPLPLSEASLLLLRPAMNAPVLNVGYLPVGPARAAVVAFAEEYGGVGIALGIRSNESGQLAVIRNQESIDFDVRIVDALEPLLAEAERMGFLFDEDMLQATPGYAGRSHAMVHWAGLMGGMESLLPLRSPEPVTTAEAEDAETAGPLSPSLAVGESQYPELILDDVAPLVLAGGEGAGASAPVDDETFEADPGADLESDLEEDLEEDLDGTLDDVLDEAMADGLGVDLDEEGSDWDDEDSLLDELDLTEPTAPVLAARSAAVPKVVPPAAPPSPAAAAEVPLPPQAVAPRMPEAPEAPIRPAPPAPPPVVLSKFRHPGGLAPGTVARRRKSEVGTDRSAELARIPIVRVRREVEKKVPFLARLLSSF